MLPICDELSNSVQSIDLRDSTLSESDGSSANNMEDPEETSIAKAIRTECSPILPPGYQLSHCLAEGGMGRVFLVVNPQTKDCLAAKVINVRGRMKKTTFNDDTQLIKMRTELRQEADLQRRLKHPHIAMVYGVRNTASFTFMFMELLPGGELFERIPIGVGLHVQQMFVYYSQILDALDYLHKDQLIAHLDVKPENIMLTKKDRAKLIDFGWAVDLRRNSVLKGPAGTTTYAAPEMFSKNSYAGPPADLFSLGVTFLTAVTGQRCWSVANPAVDPVYRKWADRHSLLNAPHFCRLPPDSANFLTRVLAHRARDRLTIDEIRAHPWFRRGKHRRLTPLAPPVPRMIRNSANVFNGDSVPSSQPVYTCLTQPSPTATDLRLSQPTDMTSMLMASEAVYKADAAPEDVRLGFSCLMKRMTRFFSALPSLDHTMEVIRAVIIQHRHLRPTCKGPGNLVVEIRTSDHLSTAFRVLLYPLAGSILVDCRRIIGDGLLFHQNYTALYQNLLAMGAVNDAHPYLRMILPEDQSATTEDTTLPVSDMLDDDDEATMPMES